MESTFFTIIILKTFYVFVIHFITIWFDLI